MATSIITGTSVSSSAASSASFGDLVVKSTANGTTINTDDFGLQITSDQGWYALQVNSPYELPLRVRSTDGTGGIDIGDNSSTNGYNRVQVVGDDRMEFYVNNVEMMELQAGEITINQGGANINTRIEGDNDENLVFIDAGQDAIGIGKAMNVGDEKLYVGGDVGITGSLHVSGNISTSGSIIAKEFRTEFVNQVVTQASGSTEFGDSIDDVHRFTGSLFVSGNIQLPDSSAGTARIRFGEGNDYQIFHDGSNAYNINSTGDLYFQQQADDKDIVFQSDDGSGGVTAYITLDGSATQTKFNQNAKFVDDVRARFGDSNDLEIWHDGTNSYINNTTGDLHISSSTSDKDIRFSVNDGGSVKDFMFMDSSNMTLQMLNSTISGVNLLQFNDPGAGEGISWIGASWSVFVSGDDMSNTAGNLQFVSGSSGAGRTNGHIAMRGHSEASLETGYSIKTQLYMPSSSLEIGNASAAGADVANEARVNIVSEGNERTLQLTANNDGTNGSYAVSMLMQGYENRGNGIFMTDTGTSGMEWFTGLPYQHNGRYYQIGADDGGLAEYRTSASIQIDYTDKWVGIGNGVTGYDLFVFNGNISGSMTSTGSFGELRIPQTGKLWFDDGSQTYIQESQNDVLDFYVGGQHMLRMEESGEDIVFVNDNKFLALGTGKDFKMHHNSANTYLRNNTGDLHISQSASDKDILFSVNDGGTILTALKIDSSEIGNVMLPNWNQALKVGASGNILLYHSSTAAKFVNITGDIEIENQADDKDIILKSDDGSGGTTAYITLDGSVTKTIFNQDAALAATKKLFFDGGGNTYIYEASADVLDIVVGGVLMMKLTEAGDGVEIPQDSHPLKIGAGSDLQLVHNGSHSYIQNYTGTMFFRQLSSGTTVFDDNNGVEHLNIDFNTAVIVNEGGANNIDFRVESNNHANMLFVDAGNDYMGIATSAPYERLYVQCEDVNSPGIVSNPAATNGAVAYAIGYGDANKDYINTWGMSYSAGATVFGYGLKPHSGSDETFVNSADNSNFTRGALYMDNELRFYNAGATTGTIDTTIATTQRFYLDASGDLEITGDYTSDTGIFQSDDASTNLKLRRGTNDDDIIEIHASETRITGDAVERCKIGSYGIKVQRDDYRLWVGASDDFSIFHDGTNTSLLNITGDLIVSQSASDADFYVKVNDGGTMKNAIQIDASDNANVYLRNDSQKLLLGAAGDLLLYHDGSNSHVQNGTGVLYLNNVANSTMYLSTNNTVRMAVTNDGQIVISGNDVDIAGVGGNATLQVNGTGGGDTSMILGRFSNNNSAPSLQFIKSRNGTIGSKTIVQDGDSLGAIYWCGDDGNDYLSYAARIQAKVDGTPGANDMPGVLGFSLCNDGESDASTEYFRMSRSGDFHADGDVFAASTQVGSDRKLKENIEEIPYGLNEVLKLRPVEFDWKERRNKAHDIGVIAQEIEKVIPVVVKSGQNMKDETSFKTVDYSKLTAVLIKAIQEQQEQIKELRKDINKLRGDD